MASSSHKIVMELTEGAHWYWDMMHDHHGTTMNKTILSNNGRISQFASNHPDEAQWMYVTTLPHAIGGMFLLKKHRTHIHH